MVAFDERHDRSAEQVPLVTSSPQALLFDFDYTLADSSSAVVECANHALKGMGLEPASPDAIRRTIGLSLPDTLAALAGEEHRSRALEFRRLWRELSDHIMVRDTKLLPGMVEALEPLREKGLRLGIVSTKYRSRIAAVLDREGVGHLFDTIVGGEDVSEHKPHPEGLLRALEQLGLAASVTLYVGDSTIDASAAERAGVEFIAVLSGVTEEAEFAGHRPKAVLGGLGELQGLL